MMNKEYNNIDHGYSARATLASGVNKVANVVKTTLGASGRNIIIQRDGDEPLITKDGVTVANHINLKDPKERLGADLVKSVASKTAKETGDGCQPYHSTISTPNGWTTMGDIKKGDIINGSDNSIQVVEEVHEKGNLELHEVKFSDGRVVECDDTHLWSIITHYGSKKTLSVKELLESKKIKFQYSNSDVQHGYYVRKNEVEFNEQEVPLDPYTVGVLIGDGYLKTEERAIEVTIGYNKKHIIDKLVMPENVNMTTEDIPKKNCIRLRFYGQQLLDAVKETGLDNMKSSEKFIPKVYLYNSRENREQLLQGLLDTDGHINNKGLFEFITISDKLAEDFRELCYSMGIPLYYRLHNRSNDPDSYSDTSIYRFNQLKGYKYGHKIVSITPTGKHVPMRCIKVSNEDSLYVTDGYILTHNTSTSTVLSQAILNTGLDLVSKGSNAVSIKRGIDKTVSQIVDDLQNMSQEIDSDEQIERIARISANGDDYIANLIKDSVKKVGRDGYVSIDNSSTMDTYLEFVEGVQFESGYLSPYFVTNSKEHTVEFENCLILFFDGKVANVKSVAHVLNIAVDLERPILIIAENVEGQALSTMVVNKMQGMVKCAAVKSPAFGDRRLEMMKDMCALTGGTLITTDTGRKLDSVTKKDLGVAKKVKIHRDATVIIDGKSDPDELQNRIELLESEIKNESLSDYERERVVERYSSLTNGVAVIKVGGSSEVEIQEKKDRIEDALYATKAAIDEGYTIGGGSALLHISELITSSDFKLENEDQEKGKSIILGAIREPFNQILINAGFENDTISKYKYDILKKGIPYGFNVKTGQIEDLLDSGIIDPTKVIRLALQNASSISSLLLTTEGMISINEDDDENVQYVAMPPQM